MRGEEADEGGEKESVKMESFSIRVPAAAAASVSIERRGAGGKQEEGREKRRQSK